MIKSYIGLPLLALAVMGGVSASASAAFELSLSPEVEKRIGHPCTRPALGLVAKRIADTQPTDMRPDLATEAHFFALQDSLYFSFALKNTRTADPIYMRQTWLARVQLVGRECQALEAKLDEFEDTSGGG